MGRTMVVNSDALRVNVLNLGDVKGTGGAITDGNEFFFNERLAVRGIVLSGTGVSFRESGTVGKHVGRDALISPSSRVVNNRIRCAAESFDDGAWSSPSRDMLGPPSCLLHLLCCRRNRDFDFLTDQKRFTTAVFI